jgi:hypothetical protein
VTPGPLGGGGGQGSGEDTSQPGRDVAGERGVEERTFVGDRQAKDLAGKL